MEGKKWLVKSEVLQDLAEVGNVAGVLDDIPTIADKPPAMILREDDDYDADMQRSGHMSEEFQKPDLYSISRMLSMVRECDEIPSFREQYPEENNIVISKLNPKVQEFIPKNIKTITLPNNAKTEEAANSNSNLNITDMNSASTSSDIKTEQAFLLKKKITEQSNPNSIKAKRERNVAIANLLKLYSSSDPEIKENNQEKTKLELSLGNTRIPEPTSPDKSNHDVCPEEMQQSIKKVDSWLNGSDPATEITNSTSTKPFLSVAPIYKRKIKKNTTEVAPDNIQPQISQVETPTRCPQFKGTENYTKLYKKFHEGSLRVQQEMNAKESQNFRRETLWDIVENKLKEKEEKRWETTTETKENSKAGPE